MDTGSVVLPAGRAVVLLRRGRALEVITLGWNVAGIVVLAIAAIRARSVALAGFGLDSLIEIGASTVVLWELSGTGEDRQRRALRLIGGAFVALAAYLAVQSAVVLATGYRPGHSMLGIAWTAVTAAVMFALAAGKARAGRQLGNPVLATEGRVTLVDGILAVAVLAGLALNAGAGVWWADPLAALVIVFYALREARTIFRPATGGLRHRPGSHLGERGSAAAELAGELDPGHPNVDRQDLESGRPRAGELQPAGLLGLGRPGEQPLQGTERGRRRYPRTGHRLGERTQADRELVCAKEVVPDRDRPIRAPEPGGPPGQSWAARTCGTARPWPPPRRS
jgi:Cation efflux family